MAIWTNDGILVVNASNEVITCADCPCGTVCVNCTQFHDFVDQFSEAEVVLDFQSAGFGFSCDGIDGTYLLDYLADPSAIDVGGYFASQHRVWVYELPTPVVINAGVPFSIIATHIYFVSNCSPTPVHRIGFRETRDDGTNAALRERWLRIFNFSDSPNFACDNPGTAPTSGSVSSCYAAASADYEFFV